MTATLTPSAPPAPATEQEARRVAEDAREKEWESPSFVRQMFEGNYRMDLVHPFPEVDPAEVERARPFMEALETFMRDRVDSTDAVFAEGGVWHMPVTRSGRTRRITDSHQSGLFAMARPTCRPTPAAISAPAIL